jgi:hypothetical protein
MGFLMSLLGPLIGRAAIPLAAGAAGYALGEWDPTRGDEPATRRRRRRRILSARDKEDLAFIEGTMGKTAASKVLLVRVASLGRA